ncbi:MAG: FAD-dependent oxidoreductase, partial [Ignavibacteriaceae bacterium]
MNKCIVIGAGFAGLSAAVYLSNKNIITTILEASPKPGGRAYSFLAKDGKTVIDNGQHILMGCYRETLRFMNMIGASENLIYQSNLEINFLQNGGEQLKLKAASLPYPINLLFGILNYKAVSFKDKLRIIKFFLKLFTYSENQLSSMSVDEWLRKENQNTIINKALWEIIAIGALNTSISKASARIFSDILKEMFFNGMFASTIILPKSGLSETYCNQAEFFIQKRDGKIKTSHTVNGFKIEDQRITEVHTDKGIISDFDYVVSAIPFYALEKIIPVSYLDKIPELKYSSILTVNIWLKDNPLRENFYGLINSPLHWIFNKKT